MLHDYSDSELIEIGSSALVLSELCVIGGGDPKEAKRLFDKSLGATHPALMPLRPAVCFDIIHSLQCSDPQNQSGGHVYVIKYSCGNVKIGMSKNPESRFKALAGSSMSRIMRTWSSNRVENCAEVERDLHQKFVWSRLNGEFFSVDFEEAVKAAKAMTE